MDRNLFVQLFLSGWFALSLWKKKYLKKMKHFFTSTGFFWVISGEQNYYNYINTNMTWPEAQSYCRARYSDLATVDSIDDQSKLMNAVDPEHSGAVWIGLKRVAKKSWVWSHGEDSVNEFSSWKPGQPKNGNDCSMMYYGVWVTYGCWNTFFFVCNNGSTEYIWNKFYLNWRDAQSYCREHYTDLASIHSTDELNLIYRKVDPASWVWIGLFQDSWEWSDKRSWYFRNWAPGQPGRSGSEDCVSMSRQNSGKWFHQSCDLQHSFICSGSAKSLTRIYEFVDAKKTWSKAQSFCRERFTDLATADTVNDTEMLLNAVDPEYSGSVWIGLTAGDKRWGWSMGNEKLSYSAWKTGEPSGDGECVSSSNGAWFEKSCSTLLSFACFNDSSGFVLIDSVMTWREAQSYCRLFHTDLVSITSEEQQDLINSLTGQSGYSEVWIGLFMDSWKWSDEWNLTFRNWKANQPSPVSGPSGCVGFSRADSGKWSQQSCDLQQPFICYGDAKFLQKQAVRIKLSCDNCALNDPLQETSILNGIYEKLKSMGLEGSTKVSGTNDGKGVFHQIKHQIYDPCNSEKVLHAN